MDDRLVYVPVSVRPPPVLYFSVFFSSGSPVTLQRLENEPVLLSWFMPVSLLLSVHIALVPRLDKI